MIKIDAKTGTGRENTAEETRGQTDTDTQTATHFPSNFYIFFYFLAWCRGDGKNFRNISEFEDLLGQIYLEVPYFSIFSEPLSLLCKVDSNSHLIDSLLNE